MASQNYFRGLAFPFSKSAQEFPASATNEDLIKQSLAQIVLTGFGERVMRPEFGSNAYDFIFENDSDAFQEFVRAAIRKAISTYETRVTVLRILVERDEKQDTQMLITVEYLVNATQNPDNVTITQGSSATQGVGA